MDSKITVLQTIKGLWNTDEGKQTHNFFQACVEAAKHALGQGFIGQQLQVATASNKQITRFNR